MKKLIILDYTNDTVDVYDVETKADIDESYIENLGYNTNNCSWMFGQNMVFTFHKEVLK